jgi:hypothetical protein
MGFDRTRIGAQITRVNSMFIPCLHKINQKEKKIQINDSDFIAFRSEKNKFHSSRQNSLEFRLEKA